MLRRRVCLIGTLVFALAGVVGSVARVLPPDVQKVTSVEGITEYSFPKG